MAIAFVNITNVAPTSGSTAVITYSSTGTNSLVLTAYVRSTTITITSVTDSAGNTWIQQTSVTNGSTDVEYVFTTLQPTAVTSVTVHFSAVLGGVNTIIHLAEYSGVQAIGTHNTLAAASTSNPSIAITTQDANNFVVAGIITEANATFTAQNGNLRQQTGDNAGNAKECLVDNTAASATSVTCSVTTVSPHTAMAVAVELRSTTGAAFQPDEDFWELNNFTPNDPAISVWG